MWYATVNATKEEVVVKPDTTEVIPTATSGCVTVDNVVPVEVVTDVTVLEVWVLVDVARVCDVTDTVVDVDVAVVLLSVNVVVVVDVAVDTVAVDDVTVVVLSVTLVAVTVVPTTTACCSRSARARFARTSGVADGAM